MANPIQLYRGARNQFRREVPYWLRAAAKTYFPVIGGLGSEKVIGQLIPNTPTGAPEQGVQGQTDGKPNYNITVNQQTTPPPTPTPKVYTAEELAAARETYDRDIAALERQRDAQLLAYQDMFTTLDQNEAELGKQRDAGITDNTGYFNRVSPDAYQSQTQTYNNKVLDAYNEGLNTVKRNKERIGQAKTNYLADYQDSLWNLENQYNADTGAYQEQKPTLTAPTITQDAVNTAAPRLMATGAPQVQAAGINTPYRQKQEQYDPWGFVTQQQADPADPANWEWMR